MLLLAGVSWRERVLGDVSNLFVMLSNFGAFGVLVWYLVAKDKRADDAKLKLESEFRAAELQAEERRIALDRERLEADKALAASLAALTGAIQSRGHE
jgi:hypothetical protein